MATIAFLVFDFFLPGPNVLPVLLTPEVVLALALGVDALVVVGAIVTDSEYVRSNNWAGAAFYRVDEKFEKVKNWRMDGSWKVGARRAQFIYQQERTWSGIMR
jgi:hypothetical protein